MIITIKTSVIIMTNGDSIYDNRDCLHDNKDKIKQLK